MADYSVIQHGVLLNIQHHGVLLLGEPGIGKSSLALSLLYQGHPLVADDSIEITQQQDTLIGRCPALARQLLHTRELGLFSVVDLFGDNAWQPQSRIDYVVQLHQGSPPPVTLTSPALTYTIAGVTMPMLMLDIHNPASLSQRLLCWLALQTQDNDAADRLTQQQQMIMTT